MTLISLILAITYTSYFTYFILPFTQFFFLLYFLFSSLFFLFSLSQLSVCLSFPSWLIAFLNFHTLILRHILTLKNLPDSFTLTLFFSFKMNYSYSSLVDSVSLKVNESVVSFQTLSRRRAVSTTLHQRSRAWLYKEWQLNYRRGRYFLN